MSRDLTGTLERSRNELRDDSAWVWLFEFEIPTSPATRLRLAANPDPIQFGVDATGAPLTYSPFPIKVGTMRETSEGDIPSIDITIGNPERILSAYIEQYDGMIGQPVKVILVNVADLGNPRSRLEDRGEIQICTVGGDSVKVRVSTYSLYTRKCPPYRYVARGCRHQYGDANCGYQIPAVPGGTVGTGFATCGKTLEACEERGADELARGVTVLHPKRYGGWRGIPRQSGGI